MKISPQKTKETEEVCYKYCYGNFVKVGVIKTQEKDVTANTRFKK